MFVENNNISFASTIRAKHAEHQNQLSRNRDEAF